MNHLYLVRHGQSVANANFTFCGQTDSPLSKSGVLQAEQTATYFADKRLDYIYSSPLIRAKHTASLIAKPHGLSVMTLPEFMEFDLGQLEGQPGNPKTWQQYRNITQQWIAGHIDTAFPEGESYRTVRTRMIKGLRQILTEKNNQYIMIVAHGGLFAATTTEITAQTNGDHSPQHRIMHNCAVTKVKITQTERDLHGQLIYWAQDDHIHGEARKPFEMLKQKLGI